MFSAANEILTKTNQIVLSPTQQINLKTLVKQFKDEGNGFNSQNSHDKSFLEIL